MRARDPLWPTAADWLRHGMEDRPPEAELAVLGIPLSVTSITQPAGAHETPEAVRRRLALLSTYHSERDVDVGELAAVDYGDLVVLAGETYADLAYHPGMDRIAAVVAGGEIVKGPGAATVATEAAP